MRSLRWLLLPLGLWVGLDLFSYTLPLLSALVGPGAAWLWVALLALMGPLWSLLLLRTGHHLRAWMPAHARALQAIAGLFLVGCVVAAAQSWGDMDALIHNRIFQLGRQLQAAASFGVLGLMLRRISPSAPPWLPLSNAVLNLPGVLLVLLLGGTGGVEKWAFLAGIFWVIGPSFAGALSTLAFLKVLWPSPAERTLRRAAEKTSALQLREDCLPVRIRHRVPCKVPFGLRVTSLEEGVPLGNPILDHLLGLATVSVADSARLLSANEDTVLGLLHRFPESHLEPDAVVFEATADQLISENGEDSVLDMVDQGMQAAERLARVLEDG